MSESGPELSEQDLEQLPPFLRGGNLDWGSVDGPTVREQRHPTRTVSREELERMNDFESSLATYMILGGGIITFLGVRILAPNLYGENPPIHPGLIGVGSLMTGGIAGYFLSRAISVISRSR